MSSSVSRLASPRVLKIAFLLLTGILGPRLFAQHAAVVPAQQKSAPALTVSGNVLSSNVTQIDADAAAQKRTELQYLHLPLSFEQNEGQADARVKFLSRGAGYGLFLTDKEAVLSFGGEKASSIKLRFLGADGKSTVGAIDRLPGTSNYFLGSDRSKWHTNVPNFGKVEYKNLYSGIDLVYYGNQQRIEHDFVVAPNADAARIRFAIDGAKKIALEPSGDLLVTTAGGELRLRKPAIYQTVNSARKEIAGGYALKHGNEVSFVLGEYDRTRELTIDPVLILSTYLADAAGVTASGVAVDGSGNIYVTGSTASSPATQLFGKTPTLNSSGRANADVFVAKLDPTGNQLLYSALIGGAGVDNATSISVDGSGNAYVGGLTQSGDFPTASSGTPLSATLSGTQDGFFLKLNSTGTSLSYSSYFGGTGSNDAVNGIAVNGGQIYLTGKTDSTTGISTANSFQPSLGSGATLNAFVAAVNPAGGGVSDLLYGTYLGGTASDSGNGIAVSGGNSVFVTGNATSSNFPVSNGSALGTQTQDAFVARIDTASVAIDALTATASCNDTTNTVTVNASNSFTIGEKIFGSGFTGGNAAAFNGSKNVASATGTQFTYVDTTNCVAANTGLSSSGTFTGGLVYGTYFGGSAGTTITSGNAIALDGSGNAYITGQTSAAGGIATGGVFQNALSGTTDAYVAKLDGTGAVTYGTYLGGTTDEQGNAIAVDGSGNAYVAGFTTSSTGLANANALYSTPPGAQDAFVAKINPTATTLIYSTYLGGAGTDVVNALALSSGVAVVAGSTNSGDIVTTANAFQPTASGNNAFVASLDAAPATTATLAFGTNTATPASVRADANNHDQITYQYVIQNTSTADAAHNTVFNDPIPGGVATPKVVINSANFKRGSATQSCPLTSPANCTTGAGGVTCQVGTVDDTTTATNSVATVCITATPNTLTPGTTIQNANATVASAETAAVTAGTLTSTVVNSTQVTVTAAQTSPTGNATVADTNSFTDRLTLHNDGPNDIQAGQAQFVISQSAATNASLSSISVTPNNPADNCGAGAGSPVLGATLPVTCTLGAVTNGTSHTFDISSTISLTAGHTGSATIQGTISSTDSTQFQLDSTSASSATQTTNVATEADLSTAVTGTNPVNSGSTVSFTVNVNSAASFMAGGVTMNANTVSATLTVNITPTTTNYTTATITPQNGDDCGAGVNTAQTVTVPTPVTCTLASVVPGIAHQFAISGTASIAGAATAGSLKVDATVAPAAGPSYTDVNTANDNAGTFTTNLTPVADLRTVVTPATQTVNNGTANTTLTVTVSNVAGSSIASTQLAGTFVLTNSSFGTVTVQPGNPGDDCGAGAGNTFTLTGTTLTCAVSRLDQGIDHAFTVKGTPIITGTNTSGSIQLNAALTAVSTYSESNPGNENSSGTVNITPVADLSSSTSGTASVNSNTSASFTIQVSNGGPNSASGTTLSGQITITNANFTPTLTPQAGDSCSTVTFGGGNPNVGTFTCTLGQINTGAPHSIGVSGTPTITGTFTSGAVKVEVLSLAGTYFDPNTLGRGVNNDPSSFTTNLVPVADLSSSTSGSASINSGSPTSFTIQVSNGGPNSVAGTTVNGQVVVTNASFAPTLTPTAGDSCSAVTFNGANPNIGTFSCTFGQIDNGSPHSLTVSGTGTIMGSFTSGSVHVEVLTLSGSYSDPSAGNDASNFTTTLIPVAHLSTSLARNTAATLQEGDPISYTLQVSNSGPNYLASGAAKVTGTFAGSGSPTAPNSVISGLTLAGCASFTVNTPNPGDYVCILPATNVAAPAVTISITGTAHVTSGIIDVLGGSSTAAPNSGGYFESSPGTTSATAPATSIQPKTHLSTSISRSTPAVVKEGDAISYTIHVASSAMDLAATAGVISGTFAGAGSAAAPNSTISGLALTNCVSFTVNTPNPGNYTCVLPAVSVATGANIIVSGTAHVITGIQDTLTGNTAAAPNGNNYFETLPGATGSNAPTSVIQPVTDLQSSIPVAPSTLQNGQTTSYVVRVTNNGTVTANNLAAGAAKVTGGFTGANSSFAINAAALPAGCTAPTSSTYSCVLNALSFGQNQSFTIVGTVTLNSGSVSDTLTLSATVSPNITNDYFDSNTTNDNTTFNTLIQGVANLTLSFSGSATPVLIGNNLTYNLTVSNAAGTSDAAGVNVTIPLAAGQVFQAGLSSGNCSGTTTITCIMGAAGVVPANTSSSSTVVVLASPALVPNGAAGNPRQATYLQSATVNVDTTQTVNSNAANKTQNVNSTFTAAAHITVQTSPSANPVIIQSGGLTYANEVYTTTVTNFAGRSDAQNVVITDIPPLGPNVTFVSANFAVSSGPSGACAGPTSGKVACTLPLLASGNTAIITVTVTPHRSATTPPTSLTDAIALTSSDVADPGPAGGTSDGSTIAVNNTGTGLSLPLTAGSSGRNVVLTFGSVTSPGVTSFDTSSNFGGLTLNPKYPLGVQPATALLYNFSTTAVSTTPVQFCLDASLQVFAKPERVRMFLLSAGAPIDITTSISPIPTAPTVGKLLSMVCGSAPFSNTSLSLALFEPANTVPDLKTSSVLQTGNPDRKITGQIVLDATPTVDPDDNACNDSSTVCHDQTQLTYLWTTSNPVGFTDGNGVPTASSFSQPNPGGVFLPLGKNQTVTLIVKDPLGIAGAPTGGIATKTFAIDVINTPIGGAVNVNPVDGRVLAKGTPVSITFGNVNTTGVTTIDSSAGVLPPARFRFGQNGLRYTIGTDAIVSGSTLVCVDTSQQRFVKPERARLFELSPTFADITTSISPVPTIPSKGQVVNTVCGVIAGFTTGTMQVAALEPVNNAPVVGLTFNLSNSQDAGKGVTGNFVDLNLASSFDPDINPCNGNSSSCSDTPQLRFFVFGPFPGALQATSSNPIIRNVSLPGGTTTITIVAIDQTITVPTNAVINAPGDLANLPGAAGQNGLTTTQFPVTIDSTTPGGGSTGNTATILAGQSASFIFTPVNPNGGVLQGSGTLNLTCSNGPTTPSLDSLHITCGVTPQTFTIGSSSAPALLVSTTGATIGLAQPSPRPGAPLYAVWVAFVGMPFAGIVIISIPGPRRRWLKILLGCGLLALAVGSQVACGGGSSMTPSTRFSTPRGTYEIVVTGTQNGTALSKNSFTITVQ